MKAINLAALNGDIETIKLLLSEGVNVDIKQQFVDVNNYGYTPLMIAVQYSNTSSSLDTVKLLLDSGANINAFNQNGYTPLMLAAKYSNTSSSLDTVKLLVDSGANINAINNKNGYTVLMFAVQYSNTSSSLDTVKLLLDSGANINDVDNYGNTALIMAVYNSNTTSSLDTVKLLVDSGSDVNISNNRGTTALMSAAQNPNALNTVKLLLDSGADVNIADDVNIDGWTALKYAAQNTNNFSSLDTVKLLLDYGASSYIDTNNMPDATRKLIEEYQWKAMYNNIIIQSKQYSKPENILGEDNIALPSDVWELILLRKKQQWLCKNLKSDKNRYILLAFAEMLEIPIPQTFTKSKLCTLISEQLAYGGKYSPSSLIYSNKRYNTAKENIIKLAYQLGIDIHQPINKILDEIGAILQ